MLPSKLQGRRTKRNMPPWLNTSNGKDSVFLDAFIVGALGGWDPANERLINHLKLGHNYCRLMRKLMVSDAIRWSRDIYV
jgi:hypothetical protein